jgi:hypothetical protein
MRFHHIGYAVKDIRAYLDDFLVPMFSPVSITDPVSDPIQQVTVCFAKMPGGAIIELVEPLGVAAQSTRSSATIGAGSTICATRWTTSTRSWNASAANVTCRWASPFLQQLSTVAESCFYSARNGI